MNTIRRHRMGSARNYPNLGAQFAGGSSQFLGSADNAALSMGAGVKLTICAWVYPTSFATATRFVAKYTGTAATSEYAMRVDTSGNLTLAQSDGASFRNSNAKVLTLNQWNFVMGQYDGTNVYVSLNAGAFTVAVTGADMGDTTTVFRVGTDSNNANAYTGILDCVGLWKRALSAAEVTLLYNGGIGMAYQDLSPALATSLAAFYDLDDAGGSGATWVDRLGTSNLTAGTTTAAPTSAVGKR